jgi:hydroxypyruvate reductase
LKCMFDAAIAAAQPAICLPQHLPPMPKGRLVVIGAGKASAAMAQAVEAHWKGPLSGLVVTRYGHAVPCNQIEIIEAAHPIPDAAGQAAAVRMLNLVKNLTEDDLVLCLNSGGGSSLLPAPLPGITLVDKQKINRSLLESGATISEMNCVRRHLSAIKGGRLAAACKPARVLNLFLSDVPGDNPIDIASGLTVPDPTSCQDALSILKRYKIEVPPKVLEILESGHGESIKEGDPQLPEINSIFIATPQMALEAAANVAREAGVTPYILGDAIEGESREVAKTLAGIARQVSRRNQPFQTPCVLISGGETTVSLRGDGRGGRNVEFLLSLAIALNSEPGIYAIAGDTDGRWSRRNCWSNSDPETLERALKLKAAC